MIQTIEDSEGRIIAYCTWYRLTKYNEYSPDFTEQELARAYIDKFWKHPSCTLTVRDCIRKMVADCLRNNDYLTEAVFNRHRNNGNSNSRFYTYTREQMLNASGHKGDKNGK